MVMIALGKVPTVLGTVLNIEVSGAWVKQGEVSRKGAKTQRKPLNLLCVLAPLREISLKAVLSTRKHPSQAADRCSSHTHRPSPNR